jgi:hypothetical protein
VCRPDGIELAGGLLAGEGESRPLVRGGPPPAERLVEVIRRAVEQAPAARVYAEFSGGVDSSLVLCATVVACRQLGVAPPVPITLRYPRLPETDETAYQDPLVEALGLTEWIRLEFHAETDLVGPYAAPLLRRHGVVFPGAIFARAPVFEAASQGLLLSGEGGDEVLGARRLGPWFALAAEVRNRRRPSSDAWRAAGASLPVPGQRRRELTRHVSAMSWLTAAGKDQLLARLYATLPSESLVPRRGLETHLRQRYVQAILAAARWMGSLHDVRFVAPLLEPDFVSSLAAHCAIRDFRDRPTIMDRHFATMLPRPYRQRRTKVHFTGAYFASHTRAFARTWDLSGLDEKLVRPAVLRDQWRGDAPLSGSTMNLLQAAWLANHPD